MINFKHIHLSDKSEIDACLEANIYRSCDFCFANMFAWNIKFKTQFDIIHKTLFVRFVDANGQLYYMIPVGPMPVNEAIELMMADAAAAGVPFQMKGITARMHEVVNKAMPDRFEYTPDRNNAEYIYLSEKLISLSGKKLQSKRNHINRFKADNPDWLYFPLTTDAELKECVMMLEQWSEAKTDENRDLKYDNMATKIMLENFDALQLKGGAIRVNGKIVAFTIGEQLTQDSFVVHVEKAFGDMNGAYTIINQQFIEHEASEFAYINREEDMGLEPLRKAKLSYQPEMILEEGFLIPKQ